MKSTDIIQERLNVQAIIDGAAALVSQIISCGQRDFYNPYYVWKKGGRGKRIICEPVYRLKIVQRELAKAMALPVHYCAKGFVQGQSILHNATAHATASNLLNADFANFYGSITTHHLQKLFENRYADLAAPLIALSTYRGALPAGAPTSPLLSNAVCFEFDDQMHQYSLQNHFQYTRYVDDISISSHGFIDQSVLDKLKETALSHGFRLNPHKTRFLSRRKALMVTGLVLNKDSRTHNYAPRIPRRVMRRIRVLIDRENKKLEISCNATKKVYKGSYVIAGYVAWAKGINPIQAQRIVRWCFEKNIHLPA